MLGQTGNLLSHNLFAYCYNNPVTNSDPSGNWVTEGISLRDSVFIPDADKIVRRIIDMNYTVNDIDELKYIVGAISYDELIAKKPLPMKYSPCHVGNCTGGNGVYDAKRCSQTGYVFNKTGRFLFDGCAFLCEDCSTLYIVENDPSLPGFTSGACNVSIGHWTSLWLYSPFATVGAVSATVFTDWTLYESGKEIPGVLFRRLEHKGKTSSA